MMFIMAISGMVAQELPDNSGDAQLLPSYVIVLEDGQENTQLPDSAFNRIAGSVVYRVNSTKLNTADPFVRELTEHVLPLANDSLWVLVGLDVHGGASPEGPYSFNQKLSRGRAAALLDYIAPQLDSVAANCVATHTVAEDYPYLLWLLERSGDSAAPVVAEIIGRYTMDRPADIKAALRAVDGGLLWHRLLRDYFPTVRAARMVLFFKRLDNNVYAVLEAPVAPELPRPEPVERQSYNVIDLPLTVERPHMLSVSSNVLYDAFYMPQYGWAPMPNIALEFYPRRGYFTYRAGFTFPYWHRWAKHKFFQIRDYHVEVRRYFQPWPLHSGPYLGAYVNATKYGIGLSARKGWQGEGLGAALKVGYVLPLGAGRWRLDFHVAAGGFVTRFDPYVYGNPVTGDVDGDYYYDWIHGSSSFHRRNHRRWWFGPTEVGVTFTYDLLFWRVSKGGTSCRRKEVIYP